MRHILTISQRIRGLRASLASTRTPRHLKQSLARELQKLEAQRPKSRGKRQKSKRNSGLLGWLS